MHPLLRLYEDSLASDATTPLDLTPLPRLIFVLHGSLRVADRTFRDGEAWHGEGAVSLLPGPAGVTCWRFELARPETDDGVVAGLAVSSHQKMSAELRTLPKGDLLLRGDSVSFPPGGCAYRHRHQGPGIRCLVEGAIRIDTHGHSTSYGPGSPWFETGPDPVFAQAAADRPSRFVRVMILPRALLGKSSIEYLDEADRAKPKTQQYKLLADMPIASVSG